APWHVGRKGTSSLDSSYLLGMRGRGRSLGVLCYSARVIVLPIPAIGNPKSKILIFLSNSPGAFRQTPSVPPWRLPSASPCSGDRTQTSVLAPASSRCPYKSLPLYSAARAG